MTGMYQSCTCSHLYQQHVLGGCSRCPCKTFSRARAPAPVSLAVPQYKPLRRGRGKPPDRDEA